MASPSAVIRWCGRISVMAALIAASVNVAFAGFGSTETFLPAVGRVPGQGGAQFYTTVWATNLTAAPQTLTFEFLKQGQANASPAKFIDNLAPGETRVYENVVESKLGFNNAIGAARVTSTGEVFVSERIYNQPPGADVGDTEGLFFAGVPKSFSISAGQSASIQGINQGGAENFRYNFALVETGGGSPTVEVQVFDGSGTLLGQKAYALLPYEQIQPNVADVVAGIATTNARITATVTGGNGSVLLAGAQLANESQDSSGFEMTFRDSLLGGPAGGACTLCVTSLNGLTGALTLKAGNGISVTPSGNQISIAYTGGGGSGLTAVAHDGSLTGDGSGASPLAIANGQVVRSLNGLHDNLTLAAGSNVTITPSGSTLTIASAAGGLTLPYNASVSLPGTAFEISNAGNAIVGESSANTALTGLSSSGTGVYASSGSGTGITGVSSSSYGVSGSSSTGTAVYGTSGEYGVYGSSSGADGVGIGVVGVNTNTGPAIYGENQGGGYAGVFQGDVIVFGGLSVHGGFSASGLKSFVSPHPTDPSKQIVYTCLEGAESGTYFRGTSRIVNGFATILVPEDFRLVTSPQGLTVQLTPVGALAVVAVLRQDLEHIVVQGSSDVEFHYLVNGVRAGFEKHDTIQPNTEFVPRSAEDGRLRREPAGVRQFLVASGILNADGSINLETAHRLGWDESESWKRIETSQEKR